MKVLVTGGAGFIGSHYVKSLLEADGISQVTVLDALTYAGHVENLGEAFLDPRMTFVHGSILDGSLVEQVMAGHSHVVHFAAESHVDRSLQAGGPFVQTNVMGTHILVNAAVRHRIERFVHVSTDEVYGPLTEGTATEASPLLPTVPYAASKAASDLIALSAFRTYGLGVCVTRSSNNFGPAQYPEKIIPLFVTRLLRGEAVTLHGRGEHVRDWLHVADNCQGIGAVMRDGEPGEIYNIAGGSDLTNAQLTEMLLEVCGAEQDLVTYIPDRQANDRRYAMDWSKIATRLGYRPVRDLKEELAATADWYRRNPERWAPMLQTSRALRPLAVPAGA
ncbi:dTDP-glucose 4,6-dehydratase [Streptomyces sp. MBT53]|uniref:dTDP-glucose 4,6-dehydratase n=1 Tax=Streptomyces sp. MBT53 TaxID=1488384 RepID=UPI001911553E|nr:dTDP-glucose 4,6-dehydratase [Streptomyces sp. MBT53]MBK6013546.1 dTDP-glucose 4,6-dehydratase [Streptomyces sp. MBT53]